MNVGEKEKIDSFLPFEKVKNGKQPKSKIVSVGGGYEFIAFLFDDGSVYISGHLSGNSNSFLKCREKITKMTCGGYNVCVLTEKNKVINFGEKIKTNLQKEIKNKNLRIVDVISGDSHLLLLDNEGYVWSSGENNYSQMGRNSDAKFGKIDFDFKKYKVKELAVGNDHSLLLTTSGEVFSWGRGSEGQQCGDLATKKFPTKLDYFGDEKIVAISCGGYHSMAITENQKIFAWGWGSYGQVGNGQTSNVTTPAKILEFDKEKERITHLACLFDHNILATDKNIYTWGWNSYGQLGLGDRTDRLSPTKIVFPLNNKTIKDLNGNVCSRLLDWSTKTHHLFPLAFKSKILFFFVVLHRTFSDKKNTHLKIPKPILYIICQMISLLYI